MKNHCDFRKANQWEYGLDLLKVLLRLFCKGCEHIELVRAGGLSYSVADRIFCTGGADFGAADVTGRSDGVNLSIAFIYWFSSPRPQSRLSKFINTKC